MYYLFLRLIAGKCRLKHTNQDIPNVVGPLRKAGDRNQFTLLAEDLFIFFFVQSCMSIIRDYDFVIDITHYFGYH